MASGKVDGRERKEMRVSAMMLGRREIDSDYEHNRIDIHLTE